MVKNDFTDEMFYLSSDKNLDEEVDKLFKYYRELGYPNYDKDDYDILRDIQKLKNFDENSLIADKTIQQNMLGLGVLWTYHPHWIEISCGNSISLKEAWDDDDKLKLLIRKTYVWKLKHNEPHWTHNRLRQNAKVFLAKQSVSNFRPTVAKYIYNKFGNNGSVLDMSSGFGGRLLGFYASNCQEYVGIEPSTKTYDGLMKMALDCRSLGKNVTLIKKGSEVFMPELVDYFDLCFTSPPYFNTEKYSDEKTQSYIKYPSIFEWTYGFLRFTIENCYKYCKNNGYLILNIANVKGGETIEADTIKLAKSAGFTHIDTMYMELSSIAKNKSRKTEPVFIFQKI